MKFLPILIAASVLLPGLFQSANAGHRHHSMRGFSALHHSHPSYHHSSYYSRYSHYPRYYSHRPSVSVSFGRSYYPGYGYGYGCEPSYYRYGSYGPSFSFRIGNGCGYWGF